MDNFNLKKYLAENGLNKINNTLTENESIDLIKKAWYDGLHTGRTTSDSTNSTKKWEQFKIENRLN